VKNNGGSTRIFYKKRIIRKDKILSYKSFFLYPIHVDEKESMYEET